MVRRAAATEQGGPTRERILDAAVAEFGERGYAGARTASIARRAGVNAQLISYHFGGKQGLLDELRQRWTQRQAALVAEDTSFRGSFTAHLAATLDEPNWSRMVIWQAFGDDRAPESEQRPRMRRGVARIRARQRSGELTRAVQPEFILLLAYALAFAPIAMPHMVSAILGDDPDFRGYRRRCVDQLMKLLNEAAA